jgi:hypothetical protein
MGVDVTVKVAMKVLAGVSLGFGVNDGVAERGRVCVAAEPQAFKRKITTSR